ncbi:CPBP family glutamic-type intramembrane protease [Microbacterium sp. NPDC055903]
MPADASADAPVSRRGASARSRRREWWQGGSSTQRWSGDLLGWAAVGLGAGILLGSLVGGMLGTVALWIALIVPVILAFRRGVPRGLLRFRPVDLLYGVVLGGMLRLAQGWLDVALGGSGALPSYPSLDGALPTSLWTQELLGGVLVAPLVEEGFFRGLVLVAVFAVVRRTMGRDDAAMRTAGVVAVTASVVLFILAHALLGAASSSEIASTGLLGLACGLLVVTTGRIWPAVLVHVVYNGTGVALAVAGTLLA